MRSCNSIPTIAWKKGGDFQLGLVLEAAHSVLVSWNPPLQAADPMAPDRFGEIRASRMSSSVSTMLSSKKQEHFVN